MMFIEVVEAVVVGIIAAELCKMLLGIVIAFIGITLEALSKE